MDHRSGRPKIPDKTVILHKCDVSRLECLPADPVYLTYFQDRVVAANQRPMTGFRSSFAISPAHRVNGEVEAWADCTRQPRKTFLGEGETLMKGKLFAAILLLWGMSQVDSSARAQNESPWSPTQSMVSPVRWGHTISPLANGKVLAIGGCKSLLSQTMNSCELYDRATNSWSLAGAIRLARWEHSATSLANGKILVVGGTYWNSKQGGRAEGTGNCEIYDPILRKSTNTGSLHQARSGHSAALLPNGRVLVVGGNSKAGPPYYTPNCEVYEPTTGKWTMTGALSQGRTQHQTVMLSDGDVLVIGGEWVGEALSSCERYNAETGQWIQAAPMVGARAGHNATLLPDGNVLVTGGYETFQIGTEHGHQRAVGSCEIYNPATDAWTSTGPLGSERIMHGATLLGNGQVLVSGGHFLDSSYPGSNYESYSSCELYNPATGNWSPAAPMNTAREGHCAVRLPFGGVLATGGSNSHVGIVAGCEVYEPLIAGLVGMP